MCTLTAYRGFESHSLRHVSSNSPIFVQFALISVLQSFARLEQTDSCVCGARSELLDGTATALDALLSMLHSDDGHRKRIRQQVYIAIL